jgi:hypothetical protein
MKQFVLIACVGILLVSCSKEKSVENATAAIPGGNNTYFIEANINGALHTFNVNDVAKMTDLGSGLKSLSITGSASSSSSDLEGINLSINFFNVAPTTGTYTEENPGSGYIAAGIYNPNSPTTVYTAGVSSTTALPLSITITKLSATEIEGTFKGAFYKTDITTGSSSTDYITMTEGSFRLPVQ